MADAKPTTSTAKRATGEDVLFTLLAALLVFNMLKNVPVLLEEKLGINVTGAQSQLGLASGSITRSTPLGTEVGLPNGGTYHQAAGDKNAAGTFPPGTGGVVLKEGPRTVGLERWWLVQDAVSGTGGWVEESALVRAGAGGVSETTRRGTEVRALVNTELWDRAGGDRVVGAVERGAVGVVSDGPLPSRGGRWWYFDGEEKKEDGWIPEAALTLGTEEAWRIGARVVATQAADLFERPGGGQTLGFLSEDEKGTVRGGPQSAGDRFWWLIETNDGVTGWVAEEALKTGGVAGWFKTAFVVVLVLASVTALALLGGLMYITLRTNQIRAAEVRRIKEALPKKHVVLKNSRWEQVMANVSSQNPNDWRLAIIEADVMLDELLTRMGYHGASLGDKLKNVARGDFATLDRAWEAHKVRNQVAHAGSDYILTQREARRVVDHYGAVFNEFKII